MTQYISKSAVVAEIKRISCENPMDNSWYVDTEELLNFINTLEVKEVDLEEEFADFLEKENAYIDDNNMISYYNGSSFNHTCDIYPLAKHFFDLGLTSSLSWQDIKLIAEIGDEFMNSEESDNLSEEEYYIGILNKFKAQKGEVV